MNRRSDMLLKDKQDEALRVMPMLFGQNGYDVTVFDPPYAGYSWIPELSIYDDCPNTTAYNTKGKFVEPEQREAFIRNNKRPRPRRSYSSPRSTTTPITTTAFRMVKPPPVPTLPPA